MIRINLLPEEYRKKSRTPIKLMLTVTSAVTINALCLAWLAFLHFGVEAEIDSERAVLQTESDGLAAQVKYHKSLEAEKKLYSMREQALSDVTKNRISWTRKIDELIDICQKGVDGKRHMVWFDDLIVQQTSDPKAKSYGSLRAAGHSGSEKFDQIANFLEDVERSAFCADFTTPSAPEGTQTQVDKDLQPAVVWAFPLSLSLKSPDDRALYDSEGKLKPVTKAPPTAKTAKPATPAADGTDAAPAKTEEKK